jgi:hypothetical protein
MPVLRSQNKPRPDDSVAPPQISQDQPPITTQTPPQPPPQVNRATKIPLTPTTPAPDARPRQHPSTPQRSTTQPSPSQRQPATPHRTQSTPFVPEKWNDKKTPIVWIAVSGIRKEKSTAFVYTTANSVAVYKMKAPGSVLQRLKAAVALVHAADSTTEILCHHDEFLELMEPSGRLRWVHRTLNLLAIEEAQALETDRAAAVPVSARVLSVFGMNSELTVTTPLSVITPQDIFQAATRSRRNTWRALPTHLSSLWREVLIQVATIEMPYDTRNAIMIAAPMIFLDKQCVPKQEELHTRLLTLVSSPQTAIAEEVSGFLSRPILHHNNAPTDLSRLRKTKMLISIGAERKALDIITRSEGTAEMTDAVAAEISTLFPKRKVKIETDPPLLESLPETADAEDIRAATFKLARGAAPGVDAWTRELLLPMFMEASAARDQLVALINNIRLGVLSPDEASFLNSSTLVALRKPNGKLRPIVLGSLFLKLAWKMLLSKISPHSHLHPSQVLGRRPCERAIHHAQRRLRIGDTLLFLDAKNAFGEVTRAAIFKKLMASPELHSLIPLFNLCYRQSSTLLAQGRTFIMDEGVRQGCAAAPFFFHLALSLALEQLDADLRKSVHCVADDVLISDSSPARIRAILDSLVPAMAEIGITVNPQKCVCVGPLSDLFTEFNSSTSVDYLGAFIALSESQQVTWEQLRGKYKQKLLAVEQLITTSKQPGSPISKQDCFLLLRYTCICFSYLLSNSNPKNTERVRDDLNKWMRAQLEARALTRLLSPKG